MPTPTPIRHKGSYKGQAVEVFLQSDGNELTDGWYVDDGTNRVKVDPEVLFGAVQLDDVEAVAGSVIDAARQRIIDAANAATTFSDFYQLGHVLADSQKAMHGVDRAKNEALARKVAREQAKREEEAARQAQEEAPNE